MSIVIDKVYAAIARENYAAIINEIAPPKIEDVVDGLQKHFQGFGIELGECDVCGGRSPEKLPDGTTIEACPFCNDGKGKEAPPPPPTPVPVAAIVVERPKPAASAPSLMLAGGRASYTEKDLDESITRLRAASNRSADSAYEMGRELALIREHLWEQRKGEDGKPKYKSYNDFLEKELEISAGYGNKLRRVAELFTIEQFRAFGIEALKALIAAPKEVHEMLLQKRAGGATVEQLESDVREIREKGGIEVVESEATKNAAAKGRNAPSAQATAAGAKARKKEVAAITVGLKEESATIDLLARPKKKGEDPRPALTIEDQPYGKIQAINGVAMIFTLKQKPTGELQLKVVALREKTEEAPAEE